MLLIRISKVSTVLAIALFASLVAFNNITDYNTNFVFVQHVFLMDTTFPGNGIMYRAINTPWVHHLGYISIITLECTTAILCWIGGVRLLRALRANSADFRSAKAFSIVGLTLGFLTWQVAFMSIGGEWFGMWMSGTWNGVESAFRFFITQLAILIYVTLPNDD
ncbi:MULTISPECIES: DUF2165 family protein [Pseudomonas]|uniref:DUF2165 family protein n=1 Tax=Pseudomonas TaxID=286 RepID=UPI00076C1F69|nr:MULTISPECIES: DUF2165 domain-containing protein [Pseudomonas]KWV69267.1 hypothetical protein PFLuk1_03174 [Pseudomonas fluorescens]